LWQDNRMVEILTPFEDEKRYINIGKIKNKFYSVITTQDIGYRGQVMH